MANKRKDELRKDVKKLRKAKFSFTDIGKMLGISRQRAQYFSGEVGKNKLSTKKEE